MTAAAPTGRTLHVIDIENLVGGSAAGPAAVGPALSAYRSAMPVRGDDHVLVGSGPALALATGLAWPGARLVLGHGVDGADDALLDAIDVAFVARRFSRVVLASGDHCFTPLAWALRAAGLAVVIVTRDETSLSRDLGRTAMHRSMALAS